MLGAHAVVPSLPTQTARWRTVCWATAIAADTTSAGAHNNLGYLLQYERKGVPGAESAYRDAIAANPKLVEAHNNLEYLLNNMKNFN